MHSYKAPKPHYAQLKRHLIFKTLSRIPQRVVLYHRLHTVAADIRAWLPDREAVAVHAELAAGAIERVDLSAGGSCVETQLGGAQGGLWGRPGSRNFIDECETISDKSPAQERANERHPT